MATELFDLTGRVALVTGAGRGLGRAVSLGLARAGADVAGVARSVEETKAMASDVQRLGRKASAHTLDVRDIASIDPVLKAVLEIHGHIDILVNNAATKIAEPVVQVTEDTWDSVIDTNLKGAFFVAQAVGRHMIERRYGKVINVASTFAVVGAKGRATYAASKGGLLQLTRVMAIEWGPMGINVNAVGPTATHTEMNEALFTDAEWRARTTAAIPMGRLGRPDDVVGAAIYLASPASDMVCGHLLLVDGGWTAI